jgi:hypothetical protein
MSIKEFLNNILNSLLDGSFERAKIISQMNTAFKEFFMSSEMERYCKVSILQGRSEFAHEMSMLWLRSGFKIGYFPADDLKYSIIVSMNKVGLPASGGLMAGSVFREIIDCIIDE